MTISNAAPTGNASLAAKASERFRTTAVRSMPRKAAGVLHVALAETKTPEAARRLLARHRIPADIRQAAEQLLAELLANPDGGDPV